MSYKTLIALKDKMQNLQIKIYFENEKKNKKKEKKMD